jgi:cobalt-zinc-cadmium efflux system outer membrane protein
MSDPFGSKVLSTTERSRQCARDNLRRATLFVAVLFSLVAPTCDTHSATLESESAAAGRSLDDAIAAAISHSALLASDPSERAAAEARSGQTSLAAPWEMTVSAENFLGTGAASGTHFAEATVELGRTLELGGKRKTRMAVAGAEAAAVSGDLALRRIAVIAAVAQRFVDVLEHQNRGDVLSREMDLLTALRPDAERRVSSGRVSSSELDSLNVSIARGRLALTQEQALRIVAQRALAAIIGLPEWASGPVQGDLAVLPALPDEAAVLDSIDSLPAVRAAEQQTDVARARLAAARATATPDVHFSVGTRRLEDLGSQAFVASWSMPLGSRRRSEAFVAEASADLATANARLSAARVEASVQLSELWAGLSASREASATLAREVLPAAVRAAETLERGFHLGRFGWLEVVTARRAVTDTEIEMVAEHARYWRSLAGLEAALGHRAMNLAAPGAPAAP